ncbi:MAG: hypothetical protein Q8L45_02295 [Xanthomonadaceae bacterium]|nr:hypothetical protein [Xanthomonadaceae bacterium]MDZ4378550.1 hypothetical protein [Xanthomonadaceae bacterium]
MTFLSGYAPWKKPRQSAKDAKGEKKSMLEANGASSNRNFLDSSFPLKRESSDFKRSSDSKRRWMPAFAGMTTLKELPLVAEISFVVFAFFASFASFADQSLLLLASPKSRVPSHRFRGFAP